jgi:hypothetical protein
MADYEKVFTPNNIGTFMISHMSTALYPAKQNLKKIFISLILLF